MRLYLVSALSIAVLSGAAAPAAAQAPGRSALGISAQQADRPSMKDSGVATLFSLLIIGGGQIYAGDTKRGLLMLGGAVVAVGTGAILSSYGQECVALPGVDCDDGNHAPLVVGAIVAVGIGVWSVLDAGPTAKRMNAKNGYKVSDLSPVIRLGPAGAPQVGLRVAF